MKETPADNRSRAVLDLLDAFKSAQAGFKTRTQRQATQPGRCRLEKKSGQGNNNKKNKKIKKNKKKKSNKKK
eukprot:evm.model.NODE_41244_length_18694_cov_23.977480.4